MRLVEIPEFYNRLAGRMDDERLAALQGFLIQHPGAGNMIEGGGGIRKIRWTAEGRGKSYGVRVIYFWAISRELILFLTIFGKNEKSDLSKADAKRLGKIAKQQLKEIHGDE